MTQEEKGRLDIIFELGKFYGYPKCCIDAFIADIQKKQEPRFRNIPNNQTGFIPCPEHSLQVISGDIKIENLIDSRVCNHQFPSDHKLD